MLKNYYWLTKPGIIYGNLINTAAGFLLAAHSHIDLWLMAATLGGIALIIASACVVNNYIDRDIDKKMARTKKRALASGTIPVRNALLYAVVLGLLGFITLALWTNALTIWLGVIAVFVYIVPYSITKRKTIYGTAVGSISGALPPVAGYVAVVGHIDAAAWLLFVIFTAWQMPHFYAIATYRLKDYQKAGLAVMTVKASVRRAKIESIAYIAVFLAANVLLTVKGYTGQIYAVVLATWSAMWLLKAYHGLHAADDTAWGRDLFLFSLKVVMVLDIMLSVGALLP